nr:hypothetical protein [Actinospica durhamensis]
MAAVSTPEQQSPHMPGEAFVRRYRDEDAKAVADICVRTADAGQDATGIYADPAILDHLFAAPYAALDPQLAFVLDDGSGRAVGYVLGTDDTHRFADRFRDEWLPRVAGRHAAAPEGDPVGPDELMAWLLHNPDRLKVAGLEGYPGHLHIESICCPATSAGGTAPGCSSGWCASWPGAARRRCTSGCSPRTPRPARSTTASASTGSRSRTRP